MSKFISRLFRIVGVILIVWTVFMLLFGGLDFDDIVFFTLMDGLVGLLLLYMGKSMKRLAKMEDKLGKYILFPGELKIPQIKCEKCGRNYDSDVSTCPYCELNKAKDEFLTRS